MSKATRTSTTPDLAPAIERLWALAAEAARAGCITEPELHPDAELLAQCAQVLDRTAEHDCVLEKARKMPDPFAFNPADHREATRWKAAMGHRRKPLLLIGKMRAKTAAGLYAKALAFRAVHYGGGMIASTVDDLIACPGLRASLWPPQKEPMP